MQPFGIIRAINTAGEDGLIFYLAGTTLAEKSQHVAALQRAMTGQQAVWLTEIVPSYDSLMIVFDMTLVDFHFVYQFVRHLPISTALADTESRLHRLPVWYGANGANDIALVRQATGLTQDAIIASHQATEYRVYAVGFAPGFAYLGELDPALSMPRLANPRKAVPKGAVAIADRQTAVYPDVSPGGWHLLGLCPVALYRPDSHKPILLEAGDKVSFYAITEAQYKAWPDNPEEVGE